MKKIKNGHKIYGGKITFSRPSKNQMIIRVTSYFDSFEFGNFDAMPQGNFYYNGYQSNNGSFYQTEDSIVKVIDHDFNFKYCIEMSKNTLGTSFLITR